MWRDTERPPLTAAVSSSWGTRWARCWASCSLASTSCHTKICWFLLWFSSALLSSCPASCQCQGRACSFIEDKKLQQGKWKVMQMRLGMQKSPQGDQMVKGQGKISGKAKMKGRCWTTRPRLGRAVAKFSSSCGGTSDTAIPLGSCFTGLCGGQWPPVAITRLPTMCRSVMKTKSIFKINLSARSNCFIASSDLYRRKLGLYLLMYIKPVAHPLHLKDTGTNPVGAMGACAAFSELQHLQWRSRSSVQSDE